VDHVAGWSQNHVVRVGCYSRAIAEAMGMDRGFVETLFMAAPLHDIGKIGIPDAIVRKRGVLSRAEQAVMEQHCLIGARILRENSRIETAFLQWVGMSGQARGESNNNPLLEMAASVALTHHERWDGSGYPQRLTGMQLPPESRIVAVSDAFDMAACGLKSRHADGNQEEQILEMIKAGAGRHFCPSVCAAFVDVSSEIWSIRERFADRSQCATQAFL